MYAGKYNHTLDTKGRLILPSKLRDSLGEEFVVTKGIDGCLFVYDKTEWAQFEEKLDTLSITSKESRKVLRFFLSGAAYVEVDKQGRFLVPTELREYAGLDKEVCMVGSGRHVEIWDRARWDAENEDIDVDQSMAYLDSIGIRL